MERLVFSFNSTMIQWGVIVITEQTEDNVTNEVLADVSKEILKRINQLLNLKE